jgi:hypothetical protein
VTLSHGPLHIACGPSPHQSHGLVTLAHGDITNVQPLSHGLLHIAHGPASHLSHGLVTAQNKWRRDVLNGPWDIPSVQPPPHGLVKMDHGALHMLKFNPMGMLWWTMGHHKCPCPAPWACHSSPWDTPNNHRAVTNVSHGPRYITMVLHHISSMGTLQWPMGYHGLLYLASGSA